MSVHINDSSVWRAFEDSELTHSAAHYLMTIMHLRQENGYARVTDVADHLKVSRGAASRAAALLKERGWIQEDPHRMLELTESGLNLARSVQRNYLIVECFLEDILKVPSEVAREDACKMEHLLSPATSSSLFRMIRILMDDQQLRERINAKLSEMPSHCGESGVCEICEQYGACFAQQSQLQGSEEHLPQVVELGNADASVASDPELETEAQRVARLAIGRPRNPLANEAVMRNRTLAELEPGQRGLVRRVLGAGDIHRRILEMGISRGVTVEVECVAPLRDPIKIKLRGYSLSLRRKEAQLIELDGLPA